MKENPEFRYQQDVYGKKVETILDEWICADVKMIHVEQTNDSCYWVGVDLADGRCFHLHFFTEGRRPRRVQFRAGPA